MARPGVYSVVIPAWNEQSTIKNVILAFRAHPLCHEIIVVSDGSTDETANVARATGAKVIEFTENQGKGAAMEAGVEKAEKDIIFFSDADILGMDGDIISSIADPVLRGKYAMSMGIQGRSIYWLNRILHFFPLLGGQRVLTKELWYSVPKVYRTRFQIETALNYYSKKFGKTAHFTLFPEMRQVKKEVKYGFWLGFWRRIKMSVEVFYVSIRLYVFDRIGILFAGKPRPTETLAFETSDSKPSDSPNPKAQ